MHRHTLLVLAALSLTALTSCHISHRGMDFSPLTDRFEPAKDDEVVLEGDTTSVSTPVATPPDVAFNTTAPEATPIPEPTPSDPFAAASAPTLALPPTPAPAPAIVPAISGSYVVKAGDTLGGIARRSHSTVPQLCAVNGLKASAPLKIGQKLRLSAAGSTPAAKTAVAKSSAKPAAKGVAKAGGKSRVHTVQAGETLYAVARKHHVSPAALMQANKLTPQTANKLRIGSTLTIPVK